MMRSHTMPFGAERRLDGSVRFRLWAPAAHQVTLCLIDGGHSPIPLQPIASGWFELSLDSVPVGALYKYQIDNAREVPDPASRFQPHDVHGPSQVIDPHAFVWQDAAWHGRPWEDAVIYELHVGCFSGTFSGVRGRLQYLADLGITALELMPVADFPGKRNWGYDGVFPFAPDSSYGAPEDLKQLVQEAHALGIMVLLDVVYNHFGPEGNYLNVYAPQFFTTRHCSPWGNGINFDGEESHPVREFFIHNALYWLEEYHFDGLRLDAVHAIADDFTPHILTSLANAVRTSLPNRQIHLVLENDRNQSTYLRRDEDCSSHLYTAQWNDDIHHALHVIVTGERDGYYSDYSESPIDNLGRCLVESFAYQGEASVFQSGKKRGESTLRLPPASFVSFLQNHDQIGNRAFGERILKLADPGSIRAAMAILLLAPAPPLLFMGEEFGAETPFLFFCDFEPDLAAAVTAGRRTEFSRFASFNDETQRERIPDPNSASTFEASRLDWQALARPEAQDWLSFYRRLLHLRQKHIVPLLFAACSTKAYYKPIDARGLAAHWNFPGGQKLALLANLGPAPLTRLAPPPSNIIYSSDRAIPETLQQAALPPWSVAWFLEP